MSSLPAFKLATTIPSPDVYRLERRRTPRRPAHGQVTAVCTLDPDGHRHQKITTLELCDSSEGGLGVRCDSPLPEGTRVAILVPPHGADHGFDLFGAVVRCQPTERGHRIGIALDRPAVACA